MAFADTSAAALAVVKEVTYGVNPVSGAVYARFTSDSLEQTTDNKISGEVTGDRNPRGLIRTNISAAGDINFEFSDNNFDMLLAGALTSSFSAPLGVSGVAITISGVSGGQFTLAGSAFSAVSLGQWIRLSGFATNGTIYARIIAIASGTSVTAQGTREDGVAVTAEVGSGIDVDGEHMKLGSTKQSFSIERQWLDINVFELFTGMNVSTASLTITPGDIIKGKFGFLGSKQEDSATSQFTGIADSGDEQIVNAVDNVEAIMEGVFTEESDLCFTEISIDIDNKLRAQNCIGVLGASGIGLGVAEIKGTIKAFLADMTQINKYLNFTTSRLSFRIKDSVGNVMIFTVPQIKFGSAQDVISGNAADGMVELTWTAEKEGGLLSDSAVQIDRFPSLLVS